MKTASMRVLSIDASLRNTGVAVVDANGGKPRALYFGVIHNANTLRASSCLVAIRDRLAELIMRMNRICALESVLMSELQERHALAARGEAILARRTGPACFRYAPTGASRRQSPAAARTRARSRSDSRRARV